MTAPVIETGTRLCRTCKSPLPPQGIGRPRVYCLDCKPSRAKVHTPAATEATPAVTP